MATNTLAPPPPLVPPPESLCLPRGYRQQMGNHTLDANRDGPYWAPWRIQDSGKWQFHVYRWAAELIASRRLASVLDVGCGVGTKLTRHIAPLCADVEGLDQAPALEVARSLGVAAKLTEVDLERPVLTPQRRFDLIICADVFEHLADPDPALRLIRGFADATTLILLSTPERDRERGRACTASIKPEHVREWSRDEFARFVHSRGLEILASRLLPKDDADPRSLRDAEAQFRLRRAEKSPLCCQAILCRVARKTHTPASSSIPSSLRMAPVRGTQPSGT